MAHLRDPWNQASRNIQFYTILWIHQIFLARITCEEGSTSGFSHDGASTGNYLQRQSLRSIDINSRQRAYFKVRAN